MQGVEGILSGGKGVGLYDDNPGDSGPVDGGPLGKGDPGDGGPVPLFFNIQRSPTI